MWDLCSVICKDIVYIYIAYMFNSRWLKKSLERRNQFGDNVLFLDTAMAFMDIEDMFENRLAVATSDGCIKC